MESKGEKIQNLLRNSSRSASEAYTNVIQEVYREKIAADVARTRKFIQQANSVIEKLQEEYGNYPEVYEETKSVNPDCTMALGKNWSPGTVQQMHLLAHHEVYRQMPYQPMKNDSIGMATALTITSKAVSEQVSASDQLELQNQATRTKITELRAVLNDYKHANKLIKQRIQEHPKRATEMEEKIKKSISLSNEANELLRRMTEMSALAKSREDSIHRQLQKIIIKMYVMMDWENAQFMNEDTFKNSIASAVTLVKDLVSNLSPTTSMDNSQWISVVPGTPEERLVGVMVRNNILLIRESENRPEVRLRSYGLP